MKDLAILAGLLTLVATHGIAWPLGATNGYRWAMKTVEHYFPGWRTRP